MDPAEENFPEVISVLRRSPKKRLTPEDRKKLAKIMANAIEVFADEETGDEKDKG